MKSSSPVELVASNARTDGYVAESYEILPVICVLRTEIFQVCQLGTIYRTVSDESTRLETETNNYIVVVGVEDNTHVGFLGIKTLLRSKYAISVMPIRASPCNGDRSRPTVGLSCFDLGICSGEPASDKFYRHH